MLAMPAAEIVVIPNGALAANCYLVICPEQRDCIIVDPGAEPERILAAVDEHGARPTRIVHTHGHFDHIGATEAVLVGLGRPVPVAAHPADRFLYEPEARARGMLFGYPIAEQLKVPDEDLTDGQRLAVGALEVEVVHTPGHSPGSVSLLCGELCLSGDTLFRRGIGRSDLAGGDEEALYESITTRLYTLPESMVVLPGHGEATTIGEERRDNPFVRA
jgi:hydroxyacylglutathione hydrolase